METMIRRPINLKKNIKFQRIDRINLQNIRYFDTLTYPKLQPRWQRKPPTGSVLGIAAYFGDKIVGLVIAESVPHIPAKVLSLFVVPPFRQQKIATALIYYLERELARQNCQQLSINYQSSTLTRIALEPLLQRLGWRSPQLTFLLAQTTTELISQASWLHHCQLPPAFSFFPWCELTARDRQSLQQLNHPASLSPFGANLRIEPINSLGLRYQEQAIGWLVTHRVAPDIIRYSTLYVAEPYQTLGRGISLIAEGIQRQIKSPVTQYKFAVAADNPKMLKFVHRRLRPYLSWVGDSYQVTKPVGTRAQDQLEMQLN